MGPGPKRKEYVEEMTTKIGSTKEGFSNRSKPKRASRKVNAGNGMPVCRCKGRF